ncbi:MAG: ribosome biogenesis GTPase Der [Deltaproteobacteria bacterium]|nr:ribosome biogenesis GTPase Der [Deltaproteobacteria bacterium]
MKPVVAIVGRPNVGKSTLFNKIIGRKVAITADEPGVTRDLNYADVEEAGRSFTIVDTGGFEPGAKDVILSQVREQALLAVEDADTIVFVMDARTGPAVEDKELIDLLRKSGKPVLYAVNKADSAALETGAAEFYAFGLKEIYPISAEHGRGVSDLLDAVAATLPPVLPEEAETDRVRIAIVGRPNVGKSSLLNRLIGRPRAIVSDIAGTTRDPVDTPYNAGERKYLFIDTAGIRKKNKVSLKVETYCVMEAIRSIERCDCALLVLDGKTGVTAQDEKIAGLIEDRSRCSVIVVNKWDVVEKDTMTTEHAKDTIRQRLPFLSWAPVVFTSALTGQRVPKVLDVVAEVMDKARERVPTSRLNGVFETLYQQHRPPAYRGKEVKFYYVTQTGVAPATFVIFTNIPEGVAEQYKRYLVNGLREAFSLEGVAIRLFFRARH